MSQSELDHLMDQLISDDAKTRRNAARQLGDLGRPEAIAELVNVYMKDADAGVRKAAEGSLEKFRGIEERMMSGDDGAAAQQKAGPNLAPLLSKLRVLLAFTLFLTVLVNAALAAPKLFPPPANVTPTPSGPTPRSQLVDSFGKRLQDARNEAGMLRKLFASIQGSSMQGVNQDQCQQLQASTVQQVDLAQIDRITYPDLKDVSDQINIPILKLQPARSVYLFLCGIKEQKDFDNQLAQQQGGAAGIIATVDEVLNKDLTAADIGLKKAIDKPAPTVGPTFTLTPTFTPTVPTSTPTVPPTITPTKPPVTPTSAATAASTGPATSAATDQANAGGAYTFSGLQLDGLTSYSYSVQGFVQGTLTNNKVFKSDVKVNARRQIAPIVAQYEVTINDQNLPTQYLAQFLGPLYVPGHVVYTVLNNRLYQTVDSVTSGKVVTRCSTFPAPADLNTKIPDINFSYLKDFPLQPKADSSTPGLEFVGERQAGDNKETLDIQLSQEKRPTVITFTQTFNPDPKSTKKPLVKAFVLTLNYTLTENVAVDASVPPSCPK